MRSTFDLYMPTSPRVLHQQAPAGEEPENFVNQVNREIMMKDGEPLRNSGVEVVSYSGRHSPKEPPTATRKMRARVPHHRLYMYERHDIIVDWLEVKELYGTSAYARAACSARCLIGYAAATNAERIGSCCM
jgi:hypothetical protein